MGRFNGFDQMPASGTHTDVTDNAPPNDTFFPSISAEGFSKSAAISKLSTPLYARQEWLFSITATPACHHTLRLTGTGTST